MPTFADKDVRLIDPQSLSRALAGRADPDADDMLDLVERIVDEQAARLRAERKRKAAAAATTPKEPTMPTNADISADIFSYDGQSVDAAATIDKMVFGAQSFPKMPRLARAILAAAPARFYGQENAQHIGTVTLATSPGQDRFDAHAPQVWFFRLPDAMRHALAQRSTDPVTGERMAVLPEAAMVTYTASRVNSWTPPAAKQEEAWAKVAAQQEECDRLDLDHAAAVDSNDARRALVAEARHNAAMRQLDRLTDAAESMGTVSRIFPDNTNPEDLAPTLRLFRFAQSAADAHELLLACVRHLAAVADLDGIADVDTAGIGFDDEDVLGGDPFDGGDLSID